MLIAGCLYHFTYLLVNMADIKPIGKALFTRRRIAPWHRNDVFLLSRFYQRGRHNFGGKRYGPGASSCHLFYWPPPWHHRKRSFGHFKYHQTKSLACSLRTNEKRVCAAKTGTTDRRRLLYLTETGVELETRLTALQARRFALLTEKLAQRPLTVFSGYCGV